MTGAHAFNAEQMAHGEPTVSVPGFLFRSEFWFQSLQNWQSEFLAVGSLVVLSVYPPAGVVRVQAGPRQPRQHRRRLMPSRKRCQVPAV